MAYRSSTSAGGGGTDTPSTTVPASVAADDIMILIAASDSPGATFTGKWPTGFTQFFDDDIAAPDGQSVGIAWKRLTGADSGSYTLTSIGSTNDWVIVAVAFSGRSTSSDPTCVHATNTSSNASPVTVTAPTVTAGTGDDLLFASCPDPNGANLANGTTAPPASYLERQDAFSTNGWAVIEAATRDSVSSGATGSVSATVTLTSGAAGWAAYHVLLPVAGGGGGPTDIGELVMAPPIPT